MAWISAISLDECNKQKDMFRILELFSSLKRLGTLRLSVICTSRLTPTIDESFETLKESLEKQRVLYHNLSLLDPEFSEETVADVGLYLKDTFLAIKKGNRHFKGIIWPSNKEMEMVISLCTKPKPLFVYASTLCRYVNGNGKNPVRRLADWLKRSDNNAEQLDEKLDETYRIVLDEVWSSTEDGGPGLNSGEKEVLVDMLRSVVLLASLLPSEHLASLLGLFPSDAVLLENLSPVLNIACDYTAPVEIVHKSFSDFLLRQKAVSTHGFRMDIAETHAMLASKCIVRMQREVSGLKRDICNLQDFGTGTDEIDEDIITKGIPLDLKYACLFWVYHLQKCREHATDQEKDRSLLKNAPDLLQNIQSFLEKHFLHWLEALSLLRSISDGVLAMGNLFSLLKEASSEPRVVDLVEDAYRFIMANRGGIEQAPLQAYASALVFSPAGSLIRQLFQDEEPKWIITRPMMEENWGSCVQTLYGSDTVIESVTFSHNGKLIASGMRNNLVKVWDVNSGECRKTFECQSECTGSVVFSPGDKQVVSASRDGIIQIWDVSNGACIKTLEANTDKVNSIALSEDGEQVAMGLQNWTIRICSVRTGSCLRTLRGHKHYVQSVAFSKDGKQVVSGSNDQTVRIWNIGSGECSICEAGGAVTPLALSPDSKRIASANSSHGNNKIVIWEVSSRSSLQELSGHRWTIKSLAFLEDDKLVSSSMDDTIKIWDASKGVCLEKLVGHCSGVMSIALSQDSKKLVSASCDHTIKIWNIKSSTSHSRLESHNADISSIALSRDGTLFASGSDDGFIQVWDAQTGACLHTIAGHNNQLERSDSTNVQSLVFSQSGKQVASSSDDESVKIWDTETGHCLKMFEKGRLTVSSTGSVYSVALSQEFKQMASGSLDLTVNIWDIRSGACVETIKMDDGVYAVAFSHDGKQLAMGTYKGQITIWDPHSGVCLKNFGSHGGTIGSVAFSLDGKLAASNCSLYPSESTIIILDINKEACIKTIEIGARTYNLSFDATGSYLYTDVGIVPLDASSTSNAVPVVFQPCSCGLTVDGQWITWDNRKAIWLPTEWRPWRSIVVPGFMVIGCSSGRVLSIRFTGEKFPYNNHPS